MDGNSYQVESKTPLGNAGAIVGKARSSGSDSPSMHPFFVAEAISDQAGTIFVESSDDGTTWYAANGTAGAAVAANVTGSVRVPVLAPFYRARYTNGATPQTTFRFATAFASA